MNNKYIIAIAFLILVINASRSKCNDLEFNSIAPIEIKNSSLFFDISEKGADFDVFGASFINNGKLMDKSSTMIKLPKKTKIIKAFLLWSAEINEKTNDFNKIKLVNSKSTEAILNSQYIELKKSAGIVYMCLSDITGYFSGSGEYSVLNLKADAIENNSFSVAGWCIIVFYKSEDKSKKETIKAFYGLNLLKATEYYNIRFGCDNNKQIISKISIIGGHGKKGNGCSNLINDISISGGEDWTGISGEMWDIWTKDIADKKIKINKEIKLTFDPLLQWIFPMIYVFKTGGV